MRKPPSTALMAVSDRLEKETLQHLNLWPWSLGFPPLVLFLSSDGQGNHAMEYPDPGKVRADRSYLVIEEALRKPLGILRNGQLVADHAQLPFSRTRCHLYAAARV